MALIGYMVAWRSNSPDRKVGYSEWHPDGGIITSREDAEMVMAGEKFKTKHLTYAILEVHGEPAPEPESEAV